MQKHTSVSRDLAEFENLESISVPEMINILQLIHANMLRDKALEDLAEPVRSIAQELWRRRELAKEVADESDAANCEMKH